MPEVPPGSAGGSQPKGAAGAASLCRLGLIGRGIQRSKSPALHEAEARAQGLTCTYELIDLETHHKVFGWVLRMLADEGLLKGNTIAIDGTTLEANAALRSIVKRDSGEAYNEFLERLAKESGWRRRRASNWRSSTGSGRKRA